MIPSGWREVIRKEWKTVTKNKWAEKIREQCKAVGTYKPEFETAIAELAEILEQKDKIVKAYKSDGCRSVVPYTNKAGAQNMTANPLLKQILDLKKIALPYWRDLGLTPAGLKKLNEDALKGKKRSVLGEAMKSIGG